MAKKVHIAGFPIRVGSQLRQLCAWCGFALIDDDLEQLVAAPGCDPTPGTWEPNALVSVETHEGSRLMGLVQPDDGGRVPRECCAWKPSPFN